MTTYIFIIFLGFAGFLLALYIWHKKSSREAMVCPLRMDCNKVVESEYSKFLGIPVEWLGMAYYAFVALGYGARATLLHSVIFGYVLFFAAAMAMLFSLYLTFIQIFALKQFCSWCLVSAFLCLSIFLLSLAGAFESVVPFFAKYRETVALAHVFGMSIGIGAATMTDIFFFKFLKDYRISLFEKDILKTISQIVWAALGIVILTGAALYLPEAATLGAQPKFLLKIAIVGIIIINGAVLNLIVEPRLLDITFGRAHKHRAGELRRARRLAFTLGPISIVSWYAAFLMGLLRESAVAFEIFFISYLSILIVGIVFGRWIEYYYDKKHTRENGG